MPAVIESYKTLIQGGDLPPLSEGGLEILRLGTRDDISASQLMGPISKDTALAAKVLRLANSPFYGLRMQVKTLEHAIVVLGQVNIVSICAASTLSSALKIPKAMNHGRYELNALRSHSVLTAILARWLAQKVASPVQVPSSFIGGLLHDIGELAIAVYYTKHLSEIRQYEQEHSDIPSYQAEQAILGFDHQELGAQVLSHWHLPQLYIDMARHHHEATYTVDTGEDMIGVLLQAADQLAGVFKDGLSHVVTSSQAQQEEVQERWKSIIVTIEGVPSGIIEKLEKDMEQILEEARIMIE